MAGLYGRANLYLLLCGRDKWHYRSVGVRKTRSGESLWLGKPGLVVGGVLSEERVGDAKYGD